MDCLSSGGASAASAKKPTAGVINPIGLEWLGTILDEHEMSFWCIRMWKRTEAQSSKRSGPLDADQHEECSADCPRRGWRLILSRSLARRRVRKPVIRVHYARNESVVRWA